MNFIKLNLRLQFHLNPNDFILGWFQDSVSSFSSISNLDGISSISGLVLCLGNFSLTDYYKHIAMAY